MATQRLTARGVEESDDTPSPFGESATRGLLQLLDRLKPTIAELTQAIERKAEKSPQTQLLMTHLGVGALTALAGEPMVGKAKPSTRVEMTLFSN